MTTPSVMLASTSDSSSRLSSALDARDLQTAKDRDAAARAVVGHAHAEIAARFDDGVASALSYEFMGEDLVRVSTDAASLYLIVRVAPDGEDNGYNLYFSEEYDEGYTYDLHFYSKRPTLARRLAGTAGEVRDARAAMNLLAGR